MAKPNQGGRDERKGAKQKREKNKRLQEQLIQEYINRCSDTNNKSNFYQYLEKMEKGREPKRSRRNKRIITNSDFYKRKNKQVKSKTRVESKKQE